MYTGSLGVLKSGALWVKAVLAAGRGEFDTTRAFAASMSRVITVRSAVDSSSPGSTELLFQVLTECEFCDGDGVCPACQGKDRSRWQGVAGAPTPSTPATTSTMTTPS